MNFKLFGVILFSLMMLGMVFAANPTVTHVTPTTGETLTGNNYWLTFTVQDYNSKLESANPPILNVYYSTTAGTYKNLIIFDSNLMDTTRITCNDKNFYNAVSCTYNWSIPSNLAVGTYYIDYNLSDYNGISSKYANYTSSSGAFIYNAVQGCTQFLIWVGIIALVLIAYGLMQLVNGNVNVKMMTSLAMGIMIGLYILMIFMQGVCFA